MEHTMTMKKKVVIGLMAAVVVYAAVYLILRWMVKRKQNNAPVAVAGGSAGTGNGVLVATTKQADQWPMKWGVKGSNVKQLQEIYNADFNRIQSTMLPPWSAVPKIKEDGIWGAETENAVMTMAHNSFYKDFVEPVAIPNHSDSQHQVTKEGFDKMKSFAPSGLYLFPF